MLIPTKDDFRKATGRNGLAKIFKKNDKIITELIDLLGDYEAVRNQMSHAEEDHLREIRRAGIRWVAANSEDIPRASRYEVINLVHQVNMRLDDIAEDLHGAPTHEEELRRAVTRRGLGGMTVGKTVDPHYHSEFEGMHWGRSQNRFGKNTTPHIKAYYDKAFTKLPMDRWAQFVFFPRSEDDPTGVFFSGNYALGQRLKGGSSAQTARTLQTSMVRMLNARERRDLAIRFEGGIARSATGTCFDTKAFRSAFSGAGWGIYVIAPNDQWYSAGHVVNHFHHSSFMAGGRVKCAGEIRVAEGGRLTGISNKTGHYKAGPEELNYALRMLQRAGVALKNVDTRIIFGPGKSYKDCKADDALVKNCDVTAL